MRTPSSAVLRNSPGFASLLSLALGVAALTSIDGCNAISGVDEFDFKDLLPDAALEGGTAGDGGKEASKDADAAESAVEDATDAALDATSEADAWEPEASVDAPAEAADDSGDAADAQDAPESDALDAEPGDAPADTSEASTGCTSDADCTAMPLAPYCDKPSARCVECLTSPDPCPKGEYCAAATLTCEPGCKSDTDCSSGKCSLAAHECVVPTPEVCTGGVDEDLDGRIDCFDTDCATSTSCKGFCSDAETIACGAVVTGKNSGGAGSTQRLAPPAYSCTAGSYPGPERAFKISGAAGQNLIAEIFGLGADLAVFAVEAPADGQCNASTSCKAFGDLLTTSNAEALGIASQAGKDYYVVVDGPAAASFSLSVQCIPAGGCFPSRAIQAGQTITARNELGLAENVTSKISHHSTFATSGWLAPEAAFIFTPTASGSYTVNARGLNGGGQFDCDLDLFLKASSACGDDTIANGATTGLKAETITVDLAAGTSYFIVVDGYATEGVPCVSQFTLSVTAN